MAVLMLVLTTLALSLTVTPLPAQTLSTSSSSDVDLDIATEESDVTGVTSALPYLESFTSSLLKSIVTSQPSNVPVHKTTAVRTPENTGVSTEMTTVKIMDEFTLETIIVAVLETTTVITLETIAEPTLETTPLPSLEPIISSVHQRTNGIFRAHAPILTSQPGSLLTPKQASTPDTLTAEPSSSTLQIGQGTTKSMAEDISASDSISTASITYQTKILTTAFTPSIAPGTPAQATLSEEGSDPMTTPYVGSATNNVVPNISPNAHLQLMTIIVIIAVVACIGGIIFMCMCFNNRRKSRSENFSSSLRNGGSNKSKRKRGAEEDAWAGPVALNGEKDGVMGGEEAGKEMDGKREGDGAQVVLSTFIAKEERKDGMNGGCVDAKEEKKKEEEVHLLFIDEDVEMAATSSPPLSSSLPLPLSEDDASEQNGSPTFCLTSVV